jgi:hypothetical protein
MTATPPLVGSTEGNRGALGGVQGRLPARLHIAAPHSGGILA